ncbi:anaphase-promoting complex subunit cdc27 [Recurvomyces mirabilis]|uniref:anaphase-promoting complex subunit cdc27 n=1 Tax=Recurvomyces mirabilis TaxID=574656 RepID=UPI002DE09D5B|nr:anaphase-promoting complex subunit cdc27 [Recurvomyces mirabilis]
MSPSQGIAATQLHQLIYYHLDNDLLDTANFLAGRLHALEPRSGDSAHLLALTYYRQSRYKAAYDYSQKHGSTGKHLGCAYIFAQSCLRLGRNTEGCTALEKAKSFWVGRLNWKKHSETTRRHLPDAPAVYTLMAKLWQAHGDARKAGDCYIEAHKANPFVWEAFEGLCKIGADLKVENMFRGAQEGGSSAPTSTAGGGVPEIYTDDAPLQTQPLALQHNFNQQVLTPSADPFNTSRIGAEGAQFMLPNAKGKSSMFGTSRQQASDWDTPTANGSLAEDDVAMGETMVQDEDAFGGPPAAPSRRARPVAQSEVLERPRHPSARTHLAGSEAAVVEDPMRPSLGGQKRTVSGQTSVSISVVDSGAPPRRSNRLFGQATTTTRTTRSAADTISSLANKVDRTVRTAKPATGAKGRTASTVGRVVSGNRKVMPQDPADKEREKRAPSRNSEKSSVPGVTSVVLQKPSTHALPQITDAQAEEQAMSSLLDSFRQLAVGSYAVARFDLAKAIQTFRTVPTSTRDTPWVLAQLGKAFYEAADYRNAEESFARLLKMQPTRVDDMEIYSTVLWHLKKESTLAFLCHSLRDQDFHAPQAWCAVGNAFSLSREHDQAISAFKRAVQVNEKFAYAWALMGHEYITNEEFEAALSAFRKAVAIDRRNYGGWYGLGKSYERMGKLEEAERHYRIASTINPSNATLLVCIGVVLERLRNRKAALANYTKALEIQPSSALARFKKARVLMHMRLYDQALEELGVLRDQAPDEANVWFLLGKCWKGLGEKSEALRALTTALNLDVKAAPFIKEAMEALDEDDEESNESHLLPYAGYANPAPDNHTKGWKVYVRPLPNGPDLTTWLKKVQFKLHHTYTDASRTIEAPGPYEVSETGYGEFGVEIRLYFASESGEKAVYREHYLVLAPYGSEEQKAKMERENLVVAERMETVEFNEPTMEFFKTLTSEDQYNWLKVKKGRGKGKKPDFVFEGEVEPTAQLPDKADAGQGGMGAGGAWSQVYERQVLAQLGQSAASLDQALDEEKRGMESRRKKMEELGVAVSAK